MDVCSSIGLIYPILLPLSVSPSSLIDMNGEKVDRLLRDTDREGPEVCGTDRKKERGLGRQSDGRRRQRKEDREMKKRRNREGPGSFKVATVRVTVVTSVMSAKLHTSQKGTGKG